MTARKLFNINVASLPDDEGWLWGVTFATLSKNGTVDQNTMVTQIATGSNDSLEGAMVSATMSVVAHSPE